MTTAEKWAARKQGRVYNDPYLRFAMQTKIKIELNFAFPDSRSIPVLAGIASALIGINVTEKKVELGMNK